MEITQTLDLESRKRISSEFLISYILSVFTVGAHTVCQLLQSHSKGATVSLPSVVLPWNAGNTSTGNRLQLFIEQGCSIFLVDPDVVMPFLDSFVVVHDQAWYTNPNKLVIVPGVTSAAIVTDIQQHSAFCELLNLIILFETHSSTTIYSLKYENLLQLSNHFFVNNSIHLKQDLFQSYDLDLNGRKLKLATFEVLPFMKLISDKQGINFFNNQSYALDGLDGILLDGFCKRYNCTWELSMDQAHQYGQLFENGSGDGMIGALLERRVDVAIGAVGGWYHLFPHFSFSATIQRIGVSCLTPMPKRMPSWIILIKIFTKTVWIVIFGCFVFCSALYFLQPGHNTSQLKIFAAFLLQPSDLRRRTLSEAILTVALLMFTINVSYIYIGKGSSMRTFTPLGTSIDTIDQLAANGVPWNAPHEAWKYSLMMSENPSIKRLLQTFQTSPLPVLKQKADRGDENFVLGLLNYGHYMIGEWINADNVMHYRLMREDLYWEYEVAWTTKTWPIKAQFDEYVMRTMEANLQRYEELTLVRKYMDHRVQVGVHFSRQPQQLGPRSLAVVDIKGILVLLVGGLCLSSVAFALELARARFATTKITRP